MPSNDDKILSDILTVSKNCRDLNDFLKCFELPLSLLQTKDAISHAVYSISESMRNKNVVYSELRFAPQLHTKKGLSQEETVRAALEGVKKCNIPVNLILCLMRSDNNEKENTCRSAYRRYLFGLRPCDKYNPKGGERFSCADM